MNPQNWTIVGLAFALGCGAQAAAEPVRVHTRSGRMLSGDIDRQTTNTNLRLRLSEPGIAAWSTVGWRDVIRVEAAGRTYSAEEFREEAERRKSTVPTDVFVKTPTDEPAARERAERVSTPRVQSLQIDAELANWDSDAEVDGLELRLRPLTADRFVAPVSGMLTARLFGQFYTPDQMFEPIREDYSRIEQWSARVTGADFSGDEAVIRLPFRRIHPEFEVDIRNNGQLNASLSVQGQGVYDASIPVTLRSYSPMRERLQQTRRTRFLPGERTGRFPDQFLGIFPGDVTGR